MLCLDYQKDFIISKINGDGFYDPKDNYDVEDGFSLYRLLYSHDKYKMFEYDSITILLDTYKVSRDHFENYLITKYTYLQENSKKLIEAMNKFDIISDYCPF